MLINVCKTSNFQDYNTEVTRVIINPGFMNMGKNRNLCDNFLLNLEPRNIYKGVQVDIIIIYYVTEYKDGLCL